MIELRRRYSGSKGSDSPSFSRLPAGYQEVEYLENTYDARLYFSVDFQTNDIISVETSFMITGRFSLYRDMCIIGVGGANKFALTISRNGNSFRYEIPNYPDRRYVDIYNDVAYDTEYSIKINTINGSYVNDNLITNEVVKGNDYYSGGVYIFNRGPLFEEPFLGRLKELVLKTNTNTFHFIPCYRISDRKPGMYDIVNNVFYTNEGTGEFSYGPDVHYNIPPEYQQVEYLESTGNQYLKIPVSIIDTDKIIFEWAFTQLRSDGFVLGSNQPSKLLEIYTYSNKWDGIFYSKLKELPYVEQKYKLFLHENHAILHREQYLLQEFAASVWYPYDGYIVLNQMYRGASINSSYYGLARYYNFEIEGKIHLIPCYRKEDNVAGMYDLVSGEFYTNAGTGEFTVGPKVIG